MNDSPKSPFFIHFFHLSQSSLSIYPSFLAKNQVHILSITFFYNSGLNKVFSKCIHHSTPPPLSLLFRKSVLKHTTEWTLCDVTRVQQYFKSVADPASADRCTVWKHLVCCCFNRVLNQEAPNSGLKKVLSWGVNILWINNCKGLLSGWQTTIRQHGIWEVDHVCNIKAKSKNK